MEQEIIETEELEKVTKPKTTTKKKKKKKKDSALLAGIISMIIGAAGMYLLVYYVLPIDNSSTIINKSEKEVTITDLGIADAVEKLYDAVVVVEVYSGSNSTSMISSGTGFVYKTNNNKAYILTNHHVVESNSKINVMVKFTDGSSEAVTIEGTDEYSDLAVLSLDADKIISVAKIGNSENLRLGDTAFAIGAPLGTEYYWTVTRGIVSGKDRMVEVSLSNSNSSDYVMRVLQTDASINSGNSGGPLANANGEVIGITNMKLVSSGVEGIGFAIPIEDAVKFAETIINGETVERPLLGVSMLNLADRYYLYQEGITLNTELKTGVVIIQVQNGSPAAKAGLKRGDIITSMDDEKITSVANLRYHLYRHSVGDTANITIEREGKKKTLEIKLTVASE